MSLLLDRTTAETAYKQSDEGVEGIVSSLTNLVRLLHQIFGDLFIVY